MNALVTLAGVAPSTTFFWLMFADEVGMRPELACFIPGNWKHFSNETLIGILRAAYPQQTVVWCDWAERPGDFTIGGDLDVLLVKVLGEKGIPPSDPKPSRLKKIPKRRNLYEGTAADVADRFDHEVPSLHEWRHDAALKGLAKREQFKTSVAVVDTSTEVVAEHCGIKHTMGSFDSLELVHAEQRKEGSTVIVTAQRKCNCGEVLTVVTKRLVDR